MARKRRKVSKHHHRHRRPSRCALGAFKAPRGCGWKVTVIPKKGKDKKGQFFYVLNKDGQPSRRFSQECLAKSVLKDLCHAET